ncbi:MAG: cupin domain-containing protein [Polyangia bacterium]
MDDKKPALLRAEEIRAREESGAHPWNPKSQLLGTRLGSATGLQRTGVNLIRIAPGKESFIYHSHYYEEEWVYILSGRGVAEIDGVEHEVGAGDFMGFATPSVAHHLRNAGEVELIYLCGGESREYEVADFPKQGRRMIRRGKSVDIYRIADAKPFGPLED